MLTISRSSLDVCILRSGPWFVRLRAKTPRLGEVLGGNLFRKGDWVELSPGHAWIRARASDRRGNTAVSPLELAQAYDGQSESWLLDPRTRSHPEPRPDFEEQETAVLAREVSAMLAEEADEVPFNVRARPLRSANCA